MSEESSTNRSIHRALNILECFLDKGGDLRLKEISQYTDLSTSTAYRIISVLQERDYVNRDKNKRYNLGKKISELGNISSINVDFYLKKIAKPHMNKLREKQKEDVRLFVKEGKNKVCIEAAHSSKIENHILNIGDKHSLMNGAPGKVFLAFMNKSNRKWLLQKSNHTEEDLKAVKKKGYAVSIGEKKKGLVGIAAPIYDNYDNIIATLSLSGPADRFVDEQISDKIQDTVETAQEISEAYVSNAGINDHKKIKAKNS